MNRIDKELVERGLAESRTKAQELIKQELVLVNEKIVSKLSTQVSELDCIVIKDNELFKYVSRGGFKLEKALRVFNYSVKDKTIMDIGSSTGGFTDCCLKNGAKKMICIDVGNDVMHPSLRNDSRVDLYENTNIKDVNSEFFYSIDLAVIDVSFISLSKIVERISQEKINIDIIALIKPQFECGKDIANKYNGVILNKKIHNEIINNTFRTFESKGFVCQGLDFSPIKGGDGNIEYLGYFSNKKKESVVIDIETIINSAFLNMNK